MRYFTLAVADLLGPVRGKDEPLAQKHKDIARSIQAMYEEALFHLLNTLHSRHQLDAVAVAGGCGMNSVANGKIKLNTPFKEVYVQSAAGDTGGAIVAAMVVWHQVKGDVSSSDVRGDSGSLPSMALDYSRPPVFRPSGQRGCCDSLPANRSGNPCRNDGGSGKFVMDHVFWGPSFSDDEIKLVLDGQGDALASAGCTVESVADVSCFLGRQRRLLRERWLAGSRGGWNGVRVRWGIVRFWVIRVARI